MRKILPILFMLSVLVSGCVTADRLESTATIANNQYKKITAKEARDMMRASNVTVVDVRTQEEYDDGHIENAILLPYTDIKSEAGTVLADKDAVVLLYCRSGRRSEIAAKELVEMGYTNVYDFGGLIDWPYGTVK